MPRAIDLGGRYVRDYKRERKGRNPGRLDAALSEVVEMLANDQPLPPREHALGGEWRGCRDLHVKPDLVLIYRLPDMDTLQLIRLGSHSEMKL
ncbi:MAG: type II toxin-antitoxin system YafQ family toxin [Janthinobacterium lividum]